MTKSKRARYTLEFKQEAVRLVESGQRQAALSGRPFGTGPLGKGGSSISREGANDSTPDVCSFLSLLAAASWLLGMTKGRVALPFRSDARLSETAGPYTTLRFFQPSLDDDGSPTFPVYKVTLPSTTTAT